MLRWWLLFVVSPPHNYCFYEFIGTNWSSKTNSTYKTKFQLYCFCRWARLKAAGQGAKFSLLDTKEWESTPAEMTWQWPPPEVNMPCGQTKEPHQHERRQFRLMKFTLQRMRANAKRCKKSSKQDTVNAFTVYCVYFIEVHVTHTK